MGADHTTFSAFRRACVGGLALLCLSAAGCLQAAEPGAPRPLVSRAQVLIGAQLASEPTGIFPQTRPTVTGHLPFKTPVAVAARNNIVYIADSGYRQVFRYDPATLSMLRFADMASGTASALTVGPDLSLYVAEVGTGQVMHYSWDGRLLPSFRHDTAMRQPVSVVVDESGGQVFIADSLYNHVVVFNGLGRALDVLRPDEAQSIESMARGPDGLYLADRIGRQVVVMAFDGRDLYTFGNDVLNMPHAIAVDRFNRVFVSDDFDNTIKVFQDRELIATIGGSGASPASFNRIAFLSLDRNTLYVADSLNGRIQSFLLSTVAPRRPGQ
ncbi:NHL repeat-containing protein [Noviherbaspirillum sp. ST9]|uniref:NHL repeat-containing protein n=1 Tax=Noviherbaspirillum sp. ST9 TaxID=3401606 RepID=UPI003B586627